MIDKIVERIRKYDDKQKEISKINRWSSDLSMFLEFIIDYFELNNDLKDNLHDDFDYPNEHKYLRQKSEGLNYIEFLLRQIKPFIPLAYELSQSYTISKKFRKGEIKEESIKNMISNFIELKRTGRKRIFYPHEKEEFEKFKQKYRNILEFYKLINSFDGKTTGSILDHGRAIRKFNIEKGELREYLLKSKHWMRNCSKATMYRFDKDLIIIKKSRWDIKHTLENYDFWLKYIKD